MEPGRIFVSWDVVPDAIKHGRRVVLRVMDVTAPDTPGVQAGGSYIQVPVKTLSGGMFVNVSPGHRYEVAVGTMGMSGDFRPLIMTETIGTPSGGPSDGDSLLEDEHFAFGPSRAGKVSSR